ncbi:uncharacterized protein E0L32_001932 [Thyridium curvatum]|uniref:Sugar phosphate transporter domain-containing protein n=1 Tax=Thyridium curvatum TaxID=1093900 RepID=A0A507AM90_9PEZI|nr:uncharacterized protein E0L32_001747 [Thyridium curvatum]XP_030990068.1 uncharacterized protein E0L32_001932 [Thyridium curvatum]TPX08172.1 hypothetical protein E0L32_001747 [Thyridium curvatum]TPX08357.1 hypothetical protein E0L32_001932 [Thyridium curvatum]
MSSSSSSAPVIPITEKPAPRLGPALHPAFYIAVETPTDIAFYRVPYATFPSAPGAVILTCWHLVFATLATQVLAKTTHLLDSRKNVRMTGRIYLRAVVPIGVLYSGSLVCSNLVYLYLSVAFIQMLKAAAPVAVLFASWVWRVKEPSWRSFWNILIIVSGVILASLGEIDFNWLGFVFQLGGIVFEAMRVVMIEVLLRGEGDLQKMDPLVSLYYYAPVCAVMNFFVAAATEFSTFKSEDMWNTGLGMLLLNAGVAFMLNVSSVFLIGKTSGLVLTLTGILKNVLLIFVSVLIWHTHITALQFLGYAVALGGLLFYSDSLKWEHVQGASTWARGVMDSPRLDETRLSPLVRKTLIAAMALLIVGMLVVGITFDDTMAKVAGRSP